MYSFEEIMRFHPDNEVVYGEIKRNLPVLVPFVGAGLSQFAYYSWPKALNEIAKKITNEINHGEVENLINQGGKCYLKAAQCLEEFRTPNNLARDIATLFSPDKLNDKKDQLPREAIWLLPLLFSGLVITTNFDQTLETVYKNNYHLFKVFEHSQLGLLNQYLTQASDYPGIFKLHGTVSGDYIEYDRIVFTEKQYEKFYGDGSTLTEALKRCLEQKTILFLGCSLSQDRTMDILENVLEEGKSYYTIINCKKSERDQKIKELGDKHIRAIVYEENRHEAVRVILEHLLEETNPDAYKALAYHVGALKSPDNRFTYNAGIVSFTGRETEMNELNAFLGDTETAFKWWAITGPGGSGKSRLAYEFKNQLPKDWKSIYLGSEDYEDLSALAEKLTEKTLLIADYVQEHSKELGKFMAKLNNNPRNLPLRVLLVEREANDESGVASWVTQLYSDVHNEASLKSACYKDFLDLQPLSDDNLKKIINDYVIAMKSKYNKGNTLSDEKTDMLLHKLKTIDPNLYRPLYAMFLTDAYIEGNDPERWNREKILDYVIEREDKRLHFNIEYVMGSEDSGLASVCKYLQCVATVLQDISLDNLKGLCSEKWNVVEQKAEKFESPEELLVKIGLAGKDEISALRPDLVGEYYVFDWLMKQRENVVHDFMNTVWKNSLPAAVFFDRIFNDYSQILNEKKDNWDIIIPGIHELPEKGVLFYSMLLVNAIYFCNFVEKIKKYVSMLEHFTVKYSNVTGIAEEYAKGLFNLINKQDEQNATETVHKLEELKSERPEVTEITILYAKSLVNLSNKQDEQNAAETVHKLEELKSERPKVTEIAVEYAKSLFNLSNKQDEQNAAETVHKLEELKSKRPEATEITVLYARSLVNLINKQDERNAAETVHKLEELKLERPEVTEITVLYARSLVNLINKQDERNAAETVHKLEESKSERLEVTEIAIEYAKGLFNLSSKQDEWEALTTVHNLEKLKSERPEVMEIAVLYVQSLVNLSSKQDEREALITVHKLEKLKSERPEVTEIAVAYAKGLVNLSSKQDEQNALKTIDRLKNLFLERPEILGLLLKDK